MQVLIKGFYYVFDKINLGTRENPKLRIWHDCSKYKDRDMARVEMEMITEKENSFLFKCSYCNLKKEFKADFGASILTIA